MALVVAVPAAGRHARIFHFGVDLGLGLEGWGEGLHQLKTEGFFHVQDSCAGVGARVYFVGLGAGEPGGDDHLCLVEEDVEAEVVAVEGDAPGGGGGGCAEEDEVVGEFIADGGAVAELAEEVVDAHG